MTFHTCCRRVIKAASESPKAHGLQYAASYARLGLGLTESDAIRVQALYILANLSRWRGDEAREVKGALKTFTQGL